ncbi:hypothetical protein BJX99DRAFT_162699 [Aspergillus californicus]
MANPLLKKWHHILALTKQQPRSWHHARVKEELAERRNATTRLQRLSETADVLFSLSRARYDGFPIHMSPSMLSPRFVPAYVYMFAKFSSRWGFYRLAAYLAGAPRYDLVREVVNPGKRDKLDEVARRHGIEQGRFRGVSRGLLRVWPLLP